MGIDGDIEEFKSKILKYLAKEVKVEEWIKENNIQFQKKEVEKIEKDIDESENSRDLINKILHFSFEDFVRYRARVLLGVEEMDKGTWNFVPTMRGYVPTRKELEGIYSRECIRAKLKPLKDEKKKIDENMYVIFDTFYASIMMLYQLDLFVVMYSGAFEAEIIEHYPGLVNFIEYIVYGALYSILEFITRRSRKYDCKKFEKKIVSIGGEEVKEYCLELQERRNHVFHRNADLGKNRQNRIKKWMEEYFRYRYVVSLVIDRIMGRSFLVEDIFFTGGENVDEE